MRPIGRTVVIRALAAVALVAVGAVGAALVLRPPESARVESVGAGPPAAPPAATGAPAAADVEIVLTPDAAARVGIKTAAVTASEAAASLTLPGTVMANAYREVKVTPIAGGIVRKVHVELGAAVRRGAPLATLFSAELAEAQTKYLSMAASYEADHKKLERTQRLVEIGAASRQELEEVTAVHESHATEVDAARQRLLLFGLGPERVAALKNADQVTADIVVPAPVDGVITARSANPGQVVATGQELFAVTDLSNVWVVGDLYEPDFQAVRVGAEAALTTPAYPGLTLRGRVSYIDPRVDPLARTAKVRVEVPNPEGRLRLGMYMTMAFTTPTGERAVLVPRAAVQTVGERHVVFLAVKGEEGKFIQRTVRIGRAVGESLTVLGGLEPGDTVVTEGSFFLRAEALRNAPSG